jgi:hypothetical protein
VEHCICRQEGIECKVIFDQMIIAVKTNWV